MKIKPSMKKNAEAKKVLSKPNKKPRVVRKESPQPPSKRTTLAAHKAREVTTPEAPSSIGKGKGRAKEIPSAVDENLGPASLPTSFKVIAGSYEKLLYGLEGNITTENSDLKFSLSPIFIFPAHISCVKAAAASPNGGKWLATGSADEIIKVWDLRRRKEIGGLMHHEGSITQLHFPSRSHLLSASEDGTLCLFRARDWAVLRALNGHKGRVNAVAVHPSGKVALSVGKDRTLRMWDLMRGKGVASTKLGKEGEIVCWSTDGSMFAVQALSTLDLYSTDMSLLHTLPHPSRIHSVKFCKRVGGGGDILLVAAEDKKLSIYNIPPNHERAPSIVAEMIGHSNRVKAVDTLSVALPTTANLTRAFTTIVCTISSDGNIHLYDLASVPHPPEEQPQVAQISPVAVYDTKGSRLTCLTLADGDNEVGPPTSGKRKRQESESEGDNGDGDEGWESLPESEEEREEEEEESD